MNSNNYHGRTNGSAVKSNDILKSSPNFENLSICTIHKNDNSEFF